MQFVIRSFSLLLFRTAFIKVVSVSLEDGYLRLADGLVSFLTTRQVLLIAAILELKVAYDLLTIDRQRSLFRLALLTSMFASYRVTLLLVGTAKVCHCLGALGSWLHLSTMLTNVISISILAYLLFGSYVLLFVRWARNAPNVETG